MIRISQLNLSVEQKDQRKALLKKAAQMLRIQEREIKTLQIIRQSVDARKKPELFYSYVIDVETDREEKLLKKCKNPHVIHVHPMKYSFPVQHSGKGTERPVIIGTGPAGLFCGYMLARAGFRPILLERGCDVDTRVKDVEKFWQTGELDTESNVQFGEGGAGTFSDGKLNTLVKEKEGRNLAVLETFVRFGADPRIIYDAKPHIGTDVLRGIVKAMREEILRLGGEVHFRKKLTGLLLEQKTTENGIQIQRIRGIQINDTEELSCRYLILAVGHSARDTFRMLYREQVSMEAKAFAVGLRVEHPQSMINNSQYGKTDPGDLGAAPYKVAAKTSEGRGVYSFCMCPGGYVVNASSEKGRLAVNGMSYSGRDGRNANSAVIVSVSPEDFGSEHPLAGVEFQQMLEERAYRLGEGRIPVQRYGDFRRAVKRLTQEEAVPDNQEAFLPQNKGSWQYAAVNSILPEACNRAFVEGMEAFGHMIEGFDREDALLSGVESRTSSPLRILRDEKLMSSVKGLYPCGEGAGYAGGITSAAMDGIRVAEAVAKAIDGMEKMQ